MTSDPQQEYADALASYREARARLQEAKRHIPPSPQDRRRQRLREEREAEHADYLANREAIDAQFTSKALEFLHQMLKHSPPTLQLPNDDHE